jgi:transglutaminase-like putative cysteine protease
MKRNWFWHLDRQQSGSKPPDVFLSATAIYLGLVLLLLAWPLQARAADKAPDWMHEAARQTLPTYAPETVAVVLLDECVTTAKGNGEIETVYRRAYKLLRPEARQEYGKLAVYFDNETKVSYLKAWGISPNGVEYAVNDKEAVEENQPYELYNDERRRLLQLPSLEPGSIVGYEYAQKKRPYVFEDEWQIQERIPVRRSRVVLNLPSGWEIATYWANYAEVKPQPDGPNQFVWEMENVPAVEHEERMPAFSAVAGRMTIKYFPKDSALRTKSSGSWRDIGFWYQQLTADRRQATPEMQKKVAELTSGAATTLEKMQALAAFLQHDIRYVAIEIGIGGVQPHPAEAVFRNRYGDCKDKVTLLSTMLHEIGVESYYVFVDTHRGIINPDVPSIAGNHAILAIRLPDSVDNANLYAIVEHPKLGRILFFDPTNSYVPLGNLPHYLQDGYGLVMGPDGGELFHLPVMAPSANMLSRSAKFSLSPNGVISGDVEEVRWGEEAATSREQLLELQPNDRVKTIESFLSNNVSNFALTAGTVGNLDHYNLPLTLKYSFAAGNYARSAGNLLIVRPRVLGQKGWMLPTEKDKKRLYPVELSEPSLESDDFEITLPPGYVVDELPAPTEAKCDYGYYHSEVEVKGNTLHYKRTYETKNVAVPPQKLDAFRDFLHQINADEKQSAVLKKAGN